MLQKQLEIPLSRPPAFAPARILEIEIGLPLAPISAFDGRGNLGGSQPRLAIPPANAALAASFAQAGGKEGPYQRAIAIVFLHDRPLGTVEFQFDDGEVSAQQCAHQIWQQLYHQINQHLLQDGLPPVTTLESQ